jgi:hypothetical protein
MDGRGTIRTGADMLSVTGGDMSHVDTERNFVGTRQFEYAGRLDP